MSANDFGDVLRIIFDNTTISVFKKKHWNDLSGCRRMHPDEMKTDSITTSRRQ